MKTNEEKNMLVSMLRSLLDCAELSQETLEPATMQLIAEAEAVFAMCTDGTEQSQAIARHLDPISEATRAAGAIVARFGMSDGLSIAQTCGLINQIADMIEKTARLTR